MIDLFTRRFFLSRAPAAAAAVALPVTAATTVAAVDVPPSREELVRYYTFLWREHCRLAEELGLAPFDGLHAWENGGYAFTDRFAGTAPSGRAKAVLDTVTREG